MPKFQDVITTTQNLNDSKWDGSIIYRGEKINYKHSIKRVVKTLRRSLQRSQFASLNLVGIPGSGKTTCAVNIVTDLIEEEMKENNQVYHLHWKGADDLRDLGNVLEILTKGENHIIVFDDVSKALDKLNATQQAEVFEKLTTTRHITGGKLLIISLYHYTFANLKSIKSQGVVVIYTSVTITEYGNILQQLASRKSKNTLRKFSKSYEESFMKGKFSLMAGSTLKEFVDGEPFRLCLVVNLFRVHMALYMDLDNAYKPPNKIKHKISATALLENCEKAYPDTARYVLRVMAFQKGYTEAVRNQFAQAHRFITERIGNEYNIDWREMTDLVKDKSSKRLYRHKKQEDDLALKIIKDSNI